MKPTSNAIVAAGVVAVGHLLGMGPDSARAQAPGTPPTTAASATSPAPADRPVVWPTAPGVSNPTPPPNPAGSGAPSAAARASYPVARFGPGVPSGRSPSGPVERSYWTAPPPPPKKPSALRRAFNFVFRTEESGGSASRAIYVDQSTGRTDLPLSKPWLKSPQ